MSELNKMLGRDFLIAFFLPSLYLFVGSYFFLKATGHKPEWFEFDLKEPLKDTILALAAFVFAIFLQSMNRPIFRATEGYWWGPIQSRLCRFEKKRAADLRTKVKHLKTEKEECRLRQEPFKKQLQYNRLVEDLAKSFPREQYILPTSFGNIVRAYEDYSRVIYGFESITGWNRIQTMLSKEASEALGRERSRLDMWLNLGFVTLVFMAEILLVRWEFATKIEPWLLPACITFALTAYIQARKAALLYGEQVKAVFDVYLPQLAEKLGFVLSDNIYQNKAFWLAYSRVMVFTDESSLKDMADVGLKRKGASASASADEGGDGGEDDG